MSPSGNKSSVWKTRAASASTLMGACLILWWLGLLPNLISTGAFLLLCTAVTAAASTMWPRRVLQVAIPALVCASCLLAGDLLWRLKPPPVFSFRPEELYLNHWPPMPAVGRFRADASFDAVSYGELSATMGRPEYREYRRLRFRSDAFGFPNDTIPARADVILLGDSFGAGSATSQEKTWASLLRTRYGTAVYNLSMPDCGPWQELMNLKLELHRIKRSEQPVLLWAIFAGNDLDDPYEENLEPAVSHNWLAQKLVALASFRKRSPVLRIFQQAVLVAQGGRHQPILRRLSTGRTVVFRPGYVAEMNRTPGDIESHPNYRPLIRVFEEMKRFTAAENLRVAVVMLPSKEEVYRWIVNDEDYSDSDSQPSAFAGAVRRLCDAEGFQFTDLKAPMVAEARRVLSQTGELLWWSDDTHWNERGHAFAAATVYRQVLQPMLVPSRLQSVVPLAAAANMH